MMKKLLILGAGTGGTIMANHLARRLDGKEWSITVVDRDDVHYYQPGFLFIPFGFTTLEKITKKRSKFLPRGVEFVISRIERIDPSGNAVVLEDGRKIAYDLLIVATGAEIVPAETPGMLDGWRDTVFDFYTAEGAVALAEKVREFQGGKVVIHINETPIKCPVAPLEFTFFADHCLKHRKLREASEIVFVTPLSAAFTKPVAAKMLGALLEERNIRVVADFNAERVDAAGKKLVGFDGREVPYDILVTVPTNMGDELIERSGMGNDLRFIPTDPKTLRSKAHENIFVIGDATDLPSSKAGSVAHFQSELLVGNVLRAIKGEPPAAEFDGHSNCFIETGGRKAILIDFNYEVEPLPGRFPFPVVGPLLLLKPSRLNHLGKLAFRWIYWNMLLKGRPIPFIPAKMKRAGKRFPRDSQSIA
jgi:sulfide:quinone oxidoreductase